MLYFRVRMPVAAQVLIWFWNASISRSRSGLCASMMAGCFSLSISEEVSSTLSTSSTFTFHLWAGADRIHTKARHPGGGMIGQGAELMAQPRLERRQAGAGAGTTRHGLM